MWRAVPGGAVRAPGHLPTCPSRKDTPAQYRTPALPAGHRDGVAGGARGCWVFDWPSQARPAARSAELENVGRRVGQFLLTARLDIIHGASVLHRFDSDEALI